MSNLNWLRWAIVPSLMLTQFAGAAAAAEPDKKLGERVFMEVSEPACQLCHTLAAAGAEGEVGPNLDEMKPDYDKVRLAVERGVGNMPPFGETLTEEQIDAVSRYVADAVKK